MATEPSLWADRIYFPWFQACGDTKIDIRAVKYGHLHLGFNDPDVEFCADNDQRYPSRIDDDGTCHFVDIPTEPRAYISTHDFGEWVRIHSYESGVYYPFNLERIRVKGTAPVRICYKKNQDTDPGEWESAAPASGTPGTWLCWQDVDPGYWDLSEWAWDIVEVKITGEAGVSSFSIDDITIGKKIVDEKAIRDGVSVLGRLIPSKGHLSSSRGRVDQTQTCEGSEVICHARSHPVISHP